MPGHLFEAAGKFALPRLQAQAQQHMLSSLDAENVCDVFALAHAHDDIELKEACAALVHAQMPAVAQSEGFKRLQAERAHLACALIARMGAVLSPGTGSGGARGKKRRRGS